MNGKKNKVSALYCPDCDTWVYSRASHDMRWCKCGKRAIDGGKGLCRALSDTPPIIKEFEIDQTDKELYDDWNNKTNQYGYLNIGIDQSNEATNAI